MKLKLSISTIIINVLIALFPSTALGEVNWQFQVGGMYLKQYGAEGSFDEKANAFNAKAGLLMQIPIRKTSPFFIETGLDWRHTCVISQPEGYKFDPKEHTFISEDGYEFDRSRYYDYGYMDMIEIPLKLGYKLQLNEKNAFDFGAGIYCGTYIQKTNYKNGLTSGITMSVAYRHRCMSFGFEWQNPIICNNIHDYNKNIVNLTIGINFGGKAWSQIGSGLVAIGSVAGAVSNAYMQTQQSNYSGNSNVQYPDNESTGKSVSSSQNQGNGFSLSEQTAYNRDKTTYEDWDKKLSMHFSGTRVMSSSEKKHAQDEMKRIRTKWEKKGKSWTKLPNETR